MVKTMCACLFVCKNKKTVPCPVNPVCLTSPDPHDSSNKEWSRRMGGGNMTQAVADGGQGRGSRELNLWEQKSQGFP